MSTARKAEYSSTLGNGLENDKSQNLADADDHLPARIG